MPVSRLHAHEPSLVRIYELVKVDLFAIVNYITATFEENRMLWGVVLIFGVAVMVFNGVASVSLLIGWPSALPEGGTLVALFMRDRVFWILVAVLALAIGVGVQGYKSAVDDLRQAGENGG